MLSRTLEYGALYTVLPFNSIFLKSQALISIYSFIFPALTIILFLYINAFLHLSANNPKISKLIIRLAFLRFFIWLLSLLFFETSFRSVFNSNYIDIVYTTFLIVIIITSIKDNWRLASIALVDIFIVYMGLISDVYLSLFDFSYDNNYDIFLFFSTIEVVVFSISIAYRYNLLKKENEKSLTLLIGQLRKNEELKDNINKELEIKVKERTWQLQQKTEEIARINQQLKSFNVELKHEVEDVTQARIFHKNMDFNEFKSIFKDEITCHKYLSELKWNEKKMYACCKCGYSNFKILENYSRKCRKCNHIESPTSGTLYNKVKFPLYKAFYITYLVSMQAKETVEEVSTILDLRVGTVGAFRQKVLAIIEKNKLKKQHNDGWTHLII